MSDETNTLPADQMEDIVGRVRKMVEERALNLDGPGKVRAFCFYYLVGTDGGSWKDLPKAINECAEAIMNGSAPRSGGFKPQVVKGDGV